MSLIHTTATDDHTGDKYVFIKARSFYAVLSIVSISLCVSILTFYLVWGLGTRTNHLEDSNDKQKQHNAAMDEMLLKRAGIQRWTYQQACDYAKSQGRLCLDNPQWWADPNKYPLIKNDPSGTGLFPSITGE